MANFIIREHKEKVDPHHPWRYDPDAERARKIAERRLPTLQFEDAGERERYEKACKSNPANIPGLPTFYPPLPNPRSCVDFDRAARECSCGGCCTFVDAFICPRCGKDNSGHQTTSEAQ